MNPPSSINPQSLPSTTSKTSNTSNVRLNSHSYSNSSSTSHVVSTTGTGSGLDARLGNYLTPPRSSPRKVEAEQEQISIDEPSIQAQLSYSQLLKRGNKKKDGSSSPRQQQSPTPTKTTTTSVIANVTSIFQPVRIAAECDTASDDTAVSNNTSTTNKCDNFGGEGDEGNSPKPIPNKSKSNTSNNFVTMKKEKDPAFRRKSWSSKFASAFSSTLNNLNLTDINDPVPVPVRSINNITQKPKERGLRASFTQGVLDLIGGSVYSDTINTPEFDNRGGSSNVDIQNETLYPPKIVKRLNTEAKQYVNSALPEMVLCLKPKPSQSSVPMNWRAEVLANRRVVIVDVFVSPDYPFKGPTCCYTDEDTTETQKVVEFTTSKNQVDPREGGTRLNWTPGMCLLDAVVCLWKFVLNRHEEGGGNGLDASVLIAVDGGGSGKSVVLGDEEKLKTEPAPAATVNEPVNINVNANAKTGGILSTILTEISHEPENENEDNTIITSNERPPSQLQYSSSSDDEEHTPPILLKSSHAVPRRGSFRASFGQINNRAKNGDNYGSSGNDVVDAINSVANSTVNSIANATASSSGSGSKKVKLQNEKMGLDVNKLIVTGAGAGAGRGSGSKKDVSVSVSPTVFSKYSPSPQPDSD